MKNPLPLEELVKDLYRVVVPFKIITTTHTNRYKLILEQKRMRYGMYSIKSYISLTIIDYNDYKWSGNLSLRYIFKNKRYNVISKEISGYRILKEEKNKGLDLYIVESMGDIETLRNKENIMKGLDKINTILNIPDITQEIFNYSLKNFKELISLYMYNKEKVLFSNGDIINFALSIGREIFEEERISLKKILDADIEGFIEEYKKKYGKKKVKKIRMIKDKLKNEREDKVFFGEKLITHPKIIVIPSVFGVEDYDKKKRFSGFERYLIKRKALNILENYLKKSDKTMPI